MSCGFAAMAVKPLRFLGPGPTGTKPWTEGALHSLQQFDLKPEAGCTSETPKVASWTIGKSISLPLCTSLSLHSDLI